MTKWRSIVGLTGSDRRRLFELADFGEVVFRASRAVKVDYDQAALVEAQRQIEEAAARERAELKARADAGELVIQPLGAPAQRGYRPWFSHVPMVKIASIDEVLNHQAIVKLFMNEEAWHSGRLMVADEEDLEIRWLFQDIQYLDQLALEQSQDNFADQKQATPPVVEREETQRELEGELGAAPPPTSFADSKTAPQPLEAELHAWARDYYERTGGKSGSRDWNRAGQKDLSDTFPGVKFKTGEAARIADQLGIKRTYER